jgi:hypothetical protein
LVYKSRPWAVACAPYLKHERAVFAYNNSFRWYQNSTLSPILAVSKKMDELSTSYFSYWLNGGLDDCSANTHSLFPPPWEKKTSLYHWFWTGYIALASKNSVDLTQAVALKCTCPVGFLEKNNAWVAT